MVFFKDQKGASAIIFAVSLSALVAVLTGAIEGGRLYYVQTKLKGAVDEAALAAAKVSDDKLQTEGDRFFKVNYPPNFLETTVSGPTYQLLSNGTVVRVTASADVPTILMKMFGINTMGVKAVTDVERGSSGLEMALVMDNTGSMSTGTRMSDMKNAAKTLLNTIYGGQETLPNTWVSVIPFVASVNIGSNHLSWLRDYDASKFPAGYPWKGCVEARTYGPGEESETPPSASIDTKWKPYFWASTKNVYKKKGGGGCDWEDGDDNDKGKGNDKDDDWKDSDDKDNKKDDDKYLRGDNDWPNDRMGINANDGTGPNLACGPAILPLTKEKSVVQAAIDSMVPTYRGGTMTNLGLAWGWRTLSPLWRGLWHSSNPDQLPKDYKSTQTQKVAVLLSDGDNNWYDWPDGVPGEPEPDLYPGADYTAYGRPLDGRLAGITDASKADDELDKRLSTVCSSMKDKGITIFTILLGVSNSSPSQTLFRNCASKPEYFFSSPSSSDLVNIFKKIGGEVVSLRIRWPNR